MNELINRDTQLPDTLEDLTQFVLVGKAKLQAYMLKLQTVNKLSVAQEIRDQTLKETQEVSNALIAAEQRIGELLMAIPKQTGNQYSASAERSEKAKSEVIAEMGYERHEASDYQQMAKHPEVVQKVLDDALASGEVVTKASVMREIKHYKDRVKAQQEEIDALHNRKPQVIEKEVVKEIVPDDYEELKNKVQRAEGYKSDYSSLRKEDDHITDKWKKAEEEKRKLLEKMNKPEEERVLNLKNECIFFCAGIRNFLSKYGGYKYLKDEVNLLPEYERKSYNAAIMAIREWSDSLLDEITIGD